MATRSGSSKRPVRSPAESGGLSIQDKLVFYTTVTITGGSVMMIELLGTRIIGPFYGVSLIVWSSLLSVALIALAIGYAVGGRLADRSERVRLSHVLFLAGLWIGLVPLISEPVQLAANGLGLRAGAFTSALVLFTGPLMLLGMAGPFVIRMAADRIEHVGATAGNVFAVSTVGSVLGTLLLGFYLLPVAGTRAIILAMSLVLIGLALCLFAYERGHLKVRHSPAGWAVAAIFAVGAVSGAAWLNRAHGYENYEVVHEEETYYGWVRVVDQPDRGIRWLMADASTIGAESLATGESLLGYQQVVQQAPWFHPDARDALLIGLGAGHLVNALDRHGIRTDSIEIDPAVARAAEDYFNFEPTGRIIVGDARYRVKQLEKQYDLIIHDCFTGGAEPIHMLSREMIGELKRSLKPGGVLVLNFVGFMTEEQGGPVASVARTLDTQFSHRRTFVSSPDARFNDFIFMVSDRPLRIERRPGAGRIGQWMNDREVDLSGNDGIVITDNFNPLETLQIAKAEYYRDLLIDRVGKEILFR